ncbi:MAG TPA: lamin tail domain-containing protein [Noviherbaspirillum sp.]|nr:lamin tail domain-containing protein [Noviherbaspirillum sp.]
MNGQESARFAAPFTKAAITLAIAVGISSCGGGGGASQPDTTGSTPDGGTTPPVVASSAPVTPVVTPLSDPVLGDAGKLIISEVATNYHSNDVAWFEVYNATSQPVDLSRYTLRSSHIDSVSGISSYEPASFPLPVVVVPSGGYLVIASKTSNALVDSPQMVYVKNDNARPFWNASGSLELVRDDATVDFVRFGNSTVAPLTAGEWNSASVPAIPSGTNEHGKSIVRLASGSMADNNAAADWVLVNFATPAGRNDVAPGVVDSDRDGIPDSAKLPGGTYAGLDLYAMGARRGRRDLFLEIDYMAGSDEATTPRREALQKLEQAFAAKGIGMHIDAGNLYARQFDPAAFHLGGGNAVPLSPCIELDTSEYGAGARAGCASFQAYKNANMDVRRRLLFHYALFANSLNLDGSGGPSGISEMSGNDIIVSLGGYGFETSTATGKNMLINMQASTLMHELGHNLGLRHGGNEDVNYKPNHYSVMNYMYQFAGLSATPDSARAADRYYLANGYKGLTYCGLVENNPCSDQFLMSYSDGSGALLDEARLSESVNIGRGSTGGAYADWDNNGVATASVFGRNINPLDGYGRTVLRDYDEWGNLQISFARGFSGSSSGLSLERRAAAPRINAMSDRHRHEHVKEEALPPGLRQMIRNLPRHR